MWYPACRIIPDTDAFVLRCLCTPVGLINPHAFAIFYHGIGPREGEQGGGAGAGEHMQCTTCSMLLVTDASIMRPYTPVDLVDPRVSCNLSS